MKFQHCPGAATVLGNLDEKKAIFTAENAEGAEPCGSKNSPSIAILIADELWIVEAVTRWVEFLCGLGGEFVLPHQG